VQDAHLDLGVNCFLHQGVDYIGELEAEVNLLDWRDDACLENDGAGEVA
jgi:hypothetical protein